MRAHVQFRNLILAWAAILASIGSVKVGAADLRRGEILFHTCAACHSVHGDGIGPDITGIFGQPAAMRRGFNYSKALKVSGVVWNDMALSAFIRNPQGFVPGTLMSFPGYQMPEDIQDVLAYLKTLK